MSPTLAPTTAPTLAPALAPAPVQNDLLETGFDSLGSLPSPTAPVPAAVAAVQIVPAAPEPATATPAPSGGFDASSKWVTLQCDRFPFLVSFQASVSVSCLVNYGEKFAHIFTGLLPDAHQPTMV